LTDLNSELFTNRKGEIIEEYFLQFRENGDCFFLMENEGRYSCRVYEARPGICRDYPAAPVQETVCAANSKKARSLKPL
jgi:Fe-S-cluster containining protein